MRARPRLVALFTIGVVLARSQMVEPASNTCRRPLRAHCSGQARRAPAACLVRTRRSRWARCCRPSQYVHRARALLAALPSAVQRGAAGGALARTGRVARIILVSTAPYVPELRRGGSVARPSSWPWRRGPAACLARQFISVAMHCSPPARRCSCRLLGTSARSSSGRRRRTKRHYFRSQALSEPSHAPATRRRKAWSISDFMRRSSAWLARHFLVAHADQVRRRAG